MLEENEYSKNWESRFYSFSLELCYMQLGPCSQSQLTQIHPGQQWKAILGKRIPFLSKHGGGMRDSSQQTKRKITTTTAITTPPPPLQLLLLLSLFFFYIIPVIIINFRKGGRHCQPQFALLLYFSNWLGKSVPRHVFITEVCEGLTSPGAFSYCHFLRGVRHYTHTQTHIHSIWNKIQIKQWKRCDSSLLCLLLGLIPRMRANLRREVDFWVLIITSSKLST